MPPTPRKPTKGRALQPDPNKSLFKFKLTWLPEQDGSQKKSETWYSYDYAVEREAFPEGIPQAMRMQWKKLLASLWKHEELYEYVKWLRPHNDNDDLVLYLPNWPDLAETGAIAEAKFGWAMFERYVHMVGFNDYSFKQVERSHPRQAGHSPGRVDFRQYYGFKYVQRNDFIVTNLATGRLVKVDIYDNIMYHSENHLHTLFGRLAAQPDPLPTNIRGGIPQSIGSMMPKFRPE